MADEQYRWLDREPRSVCCAGSRWKPSTPGTRDQVDRLAEALGALAAEPRPSQR